jgi:hypothetical protein
MDSGSNPKSSRLNTDPCGSGSVTSIWDEKEIESGLFAANSAERVTRNIISRHFPLQVLRLLYLYLFSSVWGPRTERGRSAVHS